MQALQQPWVQIQHPPAQWNLKGAADEAMLNTVHEIHTKKKIPLLKKFAKETESRQSICEKD